MEYFETRPIALRQLRASHVFLRCAFYAWRQRSDLRIIFRFYFQERIDSGSDEEEDQ